MTQRFGDDPQSIPGSRVIAKAIIKTYTAGTHKADVQLVGSHPTLLSALRVATDIPAADVVAGRQCTVLFLDPANQDDAVIITIQGALPSGGGGGTTDHAALTNLAYASAAHTGFAGTGVTNTFAALQTFNAGLQLAASQQVQDSGGTGRILLATALPHVTLTGDLRLGSTAGIGTNPADGITLNIRATGTFTSNIIIGEILTSSLTLNAANISATALHGQAIVVIGANQSGTTTITGLDFQAGMSSGAGKTVAYIAGINAKPSITAFGVSPAPTVTTLRGLFLDSPFITGSPVVPTSVGLEIGNYGTKTSQVDSYGLIIADTTNNTGFTRLLEIGGAGGTPNLRLEGRAPGNPGASKGRSQFLLSFNENGTVSLRRVEWKNPDATGHMAAADKVLVAV